MNFLIKTKIVNFSNGKIVKVFDKILSPYVAAGSGRLILLCLYYKRTFGFDEYNDIFQELLPSVSKKYIMKSGFFWGISGLMYVLIEAYKEYKNYTFLETLITQKQFLEYFFHKKSKKYFTYTGFFLPDSEIKIIETILKVFKI